MRDRVITAPDLLAKNACRHQADVFKRLWPRGARVTPSTCRLAAANELDLDWFAETFLSALAWKAYTDAKALALKAYTEATALALIGAWKRDVAANAPG